MVLAPPAPPSHRAADTSRAARRHRAGRGRRLLWTSGLAAALLCAGVVTPTLVAPEAPATQQPALEQARKARTWSSAAPRVRSVPPRTATATTATPVTSTPAPTAGATAPEQTTTALPPDTPATTATGGSTPTSPGTTALTAPGTAGTPGTPGTTVAAVPAPTAVTEAATGNPLAGMTFHGPNAGAAQAAAQPGRSAEDTAALTELARTPTATWLGAWSGDVTAAVRQSVAAARAAGAVPVLVTYNIPGRDCGGYSAGGVGSSAAYLQWVQAVAAGIGTAQAVVVVEPDALAQLCGDPAERLSVLRSAVDLLEANPGTVTYLDAGHSSWVAASTMAERLRAAGGTAADGFALNVSNFQTTAANVAYGRQVSALLGGAHFVVDTSRNGNGPGSDWCNPPGRAVGERPTAATGQAQVDAYLWIKRPGESDGTCNGGPTAGTFWDSYAIGLVRAAA
ncbi:glycoside hydrolase family 6 protein [Geodermatophilus sp. DSM 44513]|uniref:glycoside hydrolase family 6 protein n=1 Tax=Geodermatophilus sp. DSM 44513 TaxID=1528104 RepID=UPI0012832C04|nr:glycoside hydrolase family 6 protein [Geodermatophilus sp. DSM 44513]WNV75881.1 glycoside hydrolase family 6 protein [Geodermatophilus sp. DSM 44513]